MYFLKKFVKFRKEKDYLLICNCSTIQNFELPLDAFALFEELKCGYNPDKPIGIDLEMEILNDLITLDLVDTIPNSNKGFHGQNWIDLGYDENEFFKN